ncbi:MAG TPA: hypothetical protein VMN36_11755 [Verrucomicrobiales bacterium]|nr:hypothetical protein [Verrucomicrobiales bacterium]
MTLVESIANDLRDLPNAKLVEVARFVRELVPEASRRQREALAKLKGAMGDEAGLAIEEALKEEDA